MSGADMRTWRDASVGAEKVEAVFTFLEKNPDPRLDSAREKVWGAYLALIELERRLED